jgi:hypothetical protein
MDFAIVLALLKGCRRLARECWAEECYIELKDDMIVNHLGEEWRPSFDDMYAEDWCMLMVSASDVVQDTVSASNDIVVEATTVE